MTDAFDINLGGDSMKGFTLIEIILLITILSVIVPTVMIGLHTLVVQSNKAEKITVATDLARYYMELALSKRFDERIPPSGEAEATTIANWTASASLGTDAGETAGFAGINTFDDVDDFNGITNAAITGFTGYTLTMQVQYWSVNADGTWGTTAAPTPIPPNSRTNAKLIKVVVNHALIGNITLRCVTGALY